MTAIVALSLLGLCFGLKRFTALAIEATPFFVVTSVITVLYFSAYLGHLPQGAMALFVVGLACLLYIIIEYSTNKAQALQTYLTPGFVMWMGLTFVFLLIASCYQLYSWDEFSHWGPHSKFMFINHGFETADNFINHKAYPPGGRLLHYYFFQLGGFSEAKAYVAQSLLILAPFCFFAKGFTWPNWRRPFLALSFAIFIMLFFKKGIGSHVSLYMDAAVGVFMGVGIVYYVTSNKTAASILWLLPVAFALTLLKLKLMPFIFLLTGIIAVDQLGIGFCAYRDLQSPELMVALKRHWLPITKRAGAVIFIPLAACIASCSWILYLQSINVPLEWQVFTPFSALFSVMSGGQSVGTQITLSHFNNYLYSQVIPIVFFVVVSIVLCFMMKRSCARKTWIVVFSLLLIGMLLYLLGLLFMYLFAFNGAHGSFEGVNLASMHRYLSIYYILWSLVVYAGFLFVSASWQSKRIDKVEMLLVGVVLIAFVVYVFNVYKWHDHPNNSKIINMGKMLSTKVNHFTSEKSKIFVIWQNTSGFPNRIIRYQLVPRAHNPGNTSFGLPYSPGDIWTSNLTPAQLKEKMSSYDYVLVAYADPSFWQRYGALFPASRAHASPIMRYSYCAPDHAKPKECSPTSQLSYLFKVMKGQHGFNLVNVIQ